jgi:hypothetical protein
MIWILLIALLPIALWGAIVCLRDPMGRALPCYAATVPFGEVLSVGKSGFGSMSSALGVLLALGLLAQFATGRRTAARLSPAVAIWVLFLGVAVATGLWTIDRAETLSALLVLASLVVTFCLAAMSDADDTVVRRTETGLLVGGVAVVLYGLAERALFGGFDPSASASQAATTRFGDNLLGPNILAVTLLVPMAIGLQRAFDPAHQPRRPYYVIAVLMVLLGVLMTGSRTGTVGAGVVILSMIWVSPRGARYWLAWMLACGTMLAAAVWTLHPFGLANRTFQSATSSSGRLDIWQVGISACREYCLTGSGWGTFPQVYANQLATVPAARVLGGSDAGAYEAHNAWLLALIETGVVGVTLFTIGLLAALVSAVRLPGRFRPAAVGMVVGLIVGLMFLSSIAFKIFWLVLLLVVLYRNAALHDDEAAGTPAVPQEARS